MKKRIVSGIYFMTFLLTVLCDTSSLANSGPMLSSVVLVSFPQGLSNPTAPYWNSPPTFAPLPTSPYPLISAQQACLRGGDWHWRRGNVPMCFKFGHNVCPAGHPWMRQTTQRYTICLSAAIPEQSPNVLIY